MEGLNSAKVVLLGDSTVGKTSILSNFITGCAPERSKPTVGAQFMSKEITVDGNQIELRIWDTAGQEVYRGLAPMYYRSAQIAIIIFDITSQASFDAVSYWLRELRQNVQANIVTVICGNKVDLEESRTVDMTKAASVAEENGSLYIETSAIKGTGITRMFQMAVQKLMQTQTEVLNETDGKDITKKEETKKGCC